MDAHLDTRATGAGPVIDVLRYLTALAVLVSAAVHLQQYLAGYNVLSVIGPLFLVNTVAGAVLGVAVLGWRHWIPVFLAAGFGGVTAAMYWYSVLFGIFGFQETLVSGWPVVVAEIAEYVALVCGLVSAAMLFTSRQARVAGRRKVASG